MPQNDWQVGTQWNKKWNNVNWSQPGGPFTPVYPAQPTGNSDLFSTLPFNSLTGTYFWGCGHSTDQVTLQIDYDYTNDVQVALIMCPSCSYISRFISPASLAYNPIINAILTP